MTNKVEISAEPAAITLLAGDTAEVTVSIRNLGQTIDQLTLGIDGLEPDWYTVPVSSVSLFPNDQDDLRIVLHPPQAAESEPGPHPFRVNVTSQESPGEIATAEVTIQIRPPLELQLEMSPQRIVGRKGVYQIIVNNPADRETTVNLGARDAGKKLRYHFDPERLTVAGGGRSSATLEVRLGWLAFFGGEKEFDFEVAAAPPEEEGKVAHDSCPDCGRELQKGPQGTPVFCPWCGGKLREEAKSVSGQLVRTPWVKGFPRIRSARLTRFARPIRSALRGFPWFLRPPVIDVFSATTENKREFKITWSVRRARVVRLDNEDVTPKGEMLMRPAETTTYTLAAGKRRRSVSQTLDVHPLPPPQEKVCERIKASLSPARIQVYAGGVPVQASVEVQSLGEIVDKFLVEVEGLDEAWCTRSASSIALMPEATDQVQLSFQPPKKKGVTAGEYPFAINVRSQSAPEEVTTIVGQLEVLPSPEFKVDVRPKRASCRRKTTFRINLANTGVSDISFGLQASDLEEGCKFQFKTESFKVRAWDAIEVPMVAKPKRGSMVGEQKRYDVTVTATTAGEATQSVSCELNHKPLFRSWASIMAIFRVIIAIMILVVIIVLIYFVIQWGGGWNQLIHHPKDWLKELTGSLEE